MALSVAAGQVRAFRPTAHHLDQRLAREDAGAEVAGLCGLQDSPPWAAAMALHAREEGITPMVLEQALADDRTLVRTWAMRGAPSVMPTVDLVEVAEAVHAPLETLSPPGPCGQNIVTDFLDDPESEPDTDCAIDFKRQLGTRYHRAWVDRRVDPPGSCDRRVTRTMGSSVDRDGSAGRSARPRRWRPTWRPPVASDRRPWR